MRPRTNRVCIQAEVMRMQRHDRIFGIIVKYRQTEHSTSWQEAKTEVKKDLTLRTLNHIMRWQD